MGKKILMISGEASGDLHGSSLMEALKRLSPSIEIKGMGGERMRRAGLEGLDSTRLSVVGIAEVLKKLPAIRAAFKELAGMLERERFDCVVLIDYPDFNLRFAKEASKRNVPVVYYISPQVWAWRSGRIKDIARLVTKMLVIFPFEEELYKKSGVNAAYVGHPLTSTAVCGLTKDEAKAELGLIGANPVVALLPGSRTEEIKRLLPLMLEGVSLFEKRLGRRLTVILPAADGIDDALLKEFLDKSVVDVLVFRKKAHTVMRAADIAVVSSGTATLETALIGTPMVIVYKVSWLSYFIGRRLIGIDRIGLPNIVSGSMVAPELIQDGVTPENIEKEMSGIFENPERLKFMEDGYARIRRSLEGGPAHEKAAEAVMKVMGEA
ncbi:MAG: lipid-A-disaccharide synthase [Thermodesulfobacteriota bacterium]